MSSGVAQRAAAEPTAKRNILVVDDDSVTRFLIVHHLKRGGFNVIAAQGVKEARELVRQATIGSFHGVVTDYLMPDGTGLELIDWLKGEDPNLGAIIVTSLSERDLVKQSLRGGACDFLDKPLQVEALLQSVRNAVEYTERGRHLQETESSVREVGRFQQFLLGTNTEELAAPVEICWHPRHPVGGDLVNVITLGPRRFLLVAADVSGHDLKAGFISAYFQGVMRGMVERGAAIEDVFAYFNRFLITEWSRQQHGQWGTESVAASISACAFVIDGDQQQLAVCNSGFPRPIFTNGAGQAEPCGQQPGFPLGWFPDQTIDVLQRSFAQGGAVYLWTDGLEDLAASLAIHPLALATDLLAARRAGHTAPALKSAHDDILVVRLDLSGGRLGGGPWCPLIYQELLAGQETEIDAFQALWERSLRFAVPALAEDRLLDLLLCAREAVMNAIRHGCGTAGPGPTTLHIGVDGPRTLLRVVVRDAGSGHDFCWSSHIETAAEELGERHRGLALMHQLPTATRVERNGAVVTMEFSLRQP